MKTGKMTLEEMNKATLQTLVDALVGVSQQVGEASRNMGNDCDSRKYAGELRETILRRFSPGPSTLGWR